MSKLLAVFATALLTQLSASQLGSAQSTHHQPYGAIKDRALKALSDEQIADLRAGRGMGLALPAELNGYPGPMHVLEHADALDLSPAQRVQVDGMIASMKAEAIRLGDRLIEQEFELDRLFADRKIQPASMETATAAIASTQGQLRAAHLRYHLLMMDVLSPAQVDLYAKARGYQQNDHHKGHGQGHGQHAR